MAITFKNYKCTKCHNRREQVHVIGANSFPAHTANKAPGRTSGTKTQTTVQGLPSSLMSPAEITMNQLNSTGVINSKTGRM